MERDAKLAYCCTNEASGVSAELEKPAPRQCIIPTYPRAVQPRLKGVTNINHCGRAFEQDNRVSVFQRTRITLLLLSLLRSGERVGTATHPRFPVEKRGPWLRNIAEYSGANRVASYGAA